MPTERLTFDSIQSARRFDKSGFLHVEACNLTKEQVAPYWGREIPGWEALGLDPEKMYRVYRPAEELSKPSTVNSVNGIPIQFHHHDDTADSPAKATRVGATGDSAIWQAPYLKNSLHIHDRAAIQAIEDGSTKELSLSYWYTPDLTPGETQKGEPYDLIMRDIKANHVALVEEGRAGSDVKVSDHSFIPNRGENMDESEVKPDALEEEKKEQVEDEVEPMVELTEEEGKEEKSVDAGDPTALLEAVEKLDPAAKKAFVAMLDTLRAAVADQAEQGEDEEPEEDPREEEKRDDLDPIVDAGLKACGLDAEAPEVQKAFAEGVRYGEKMEKKEPAKLDREHESEGEKRALGEDEEVDETEDLEEVKEKAADAAIRHMKALFRAHDAVAPTMGKVRLGAYDSADALYQAAFKRETGRNIDAKAARTAYLSYMAGKKQRTTAAKANDAASGFDPALAKYL